MGAFADKFKFDLDGGRLSLDFVNTVSGSTSRFSKGMCVACARCSRESI